MSISKVLSRISTVLLIVLILEIITPAFSRAEEITPSQITTSNSQQLESASNSPDVQDEDYEEDDGSQSDAQNSDDAKDFTNIIKQTTEYTCGPAALATLINLMGGIAAEKQLSDLSGTTEEKGTTLLGLKNAAKSLGYDVALKNVKMDNLGKYKFPILAHENNKEDGDHYIVINGITKEGYKIADPSAGNIEISGDDFRDSFTGKILMLSLPKEIKSGQSADVALQILENKGVEEVSVDGKMIDIDDFKEELSDSDAENINGKFIQLIIIPVAEIGYVMAVGGAIVYTGYLSYMFSKGGKSKKNTEKGIKSKVDEIKRHKDKIKKDPKSKSRKHWEGEIKELEKQVKKDLQKARNKFKKTFDWNF